MKSRWKAVVIRIPCDDIRSLNGLKGIEALEVLFKVFQCVQVEDFKETKSPCLQMSTASFSALKSPVRRPGFIGRGDVGGRQFRAVGLRTKSGVESGGS